MYLAISLAVIVIVIIVIAISIPRKKYIVSSFDGVVLINKDIQLEKSDIQYYTDLREEFDRRKSFYDTFRKNAEILYEEDELFDLPDDLQYHLDNQNVHDTMIQDNLKNKMKTVGNTSLVSLNDISSDPGVISILSEISNRNAYLSNFDRTESSLILDVWSNGDDLVKQEVINQIKDCRDSYGMLVCPTGVASRISSSLYINDPTHAPKTKEILNQEILNKFSKLYKKTQDKSYITDVIVSEYRGVYSEDKIRGIINEWVNFI